MNWFWKLIDRIMSPMYPSLDRIPSEEPVIPASVPSPAAPLPATPPILPQDEGLLWDTPSHAFHSTRILCDELGLTFKQKNILCACIYQESQFKNAAVGKNQGSTDWGIVQINDYFHIGSGKTFPSVEYVLGNPEKCVRWMIGILKTTGKLQPWVSYTSGAYLKWLSTSSPMWLLKT